MMQNDTEVLFPPRFISELGDTRGEAWRDLIHQVASEPEPALHRTSFVLMMARLNGCSTCHANSFRALQGCLACSRQALRRFRGGDEELFKMYEQAQIEVLQYLGSGT